MTAELRDSLAQVQELKPCPFCGSAAKIWTPEVGDGPDAAMCTNKDCDASVYFITPEHWNRRHGAGDADRSAELTTAWMAGVERERDRAAEAWRSIESAPKDGRAVLLAHIGGKPYIGKWCHDTWMDERGLSRGPSHWRPLPAPPTDDAARAGERG